MNELLYASRLEKNLLSVLAMGVRGLEVNFMTGEVVVGLKGTDLSTKWVIGRRERDLCLLQGQLVKALIHDSDSHIEIWRKRMGHLHYIALSMVWRIVTGFPEIRVE